MFATGAGAVGNQSIGFGAVGGMLVGTILGVFVIPALFIIFQSLQEKLSGPARERRLKQLAEEEAQNALNAKA
jgi:HAE1 family hydrophobic/amphiphilic exporter-1